MVYGEHDDIYGRDANSILRWSECYVRSGTGGSRSSLLFLRLLLLISLRLRLIRPTSPPKSLSISYSQPSLKYEGDVLTSAYPTRPCPYHDARRIPVEPLRGRIVVSLGLCLCLGWGP